jgi:hypothetical protein
VAAVRAAAAVVGASAVSIVVRGGEDLCTGAFVFAAGVLLVAEVGVAAGVSLDRGDTVFAVTGCAAAGMVAILVSARSYR